MRIFFITVILCLTQQLIAQNAYIQVNGERELSIYLKSIFKGKTTAELGVTLLRL
jgi:hypothetical protein